MQPTVTTVSNTTYVVEEVNRSPKSVYASLEGTSSGLIPDLPNYDAKRIAITPHELSVFERFSKTVNRYANFMYDSKAFSTYIKENSSVELSQDYLTSLTSVARKNNVQLGLLDETIDKAKSNMNIKALEFVSLHDSSTGNDDFYVRFTLNTETDSKFDQFNRYIDNYLGDIDIKQSNIHVSVA